MRAAWLAVLLAGCGLSDYEKKMQDTETRAARFEEQAKVLGIPLDLPLPDPKQKDFPTLPRVSMRPPRGLVNQPGKAPRPGGRWVYSPVSPKSAAPFAEVELAFGKAADKDFHKSLL